MNCDQYKDIIQTKPQLTDIYNEIKGVKPETVVAKPTAVPKVEPPKVKPEQGVSLHWEKVKQALNLKDDSRVIFDRIVRSEEDTKSLEFIQKDIDRAIKSAFGSEPIPPSINESSLQRVTAQVLRAKGEKELADLIDKQLSKRLTEAAQTLGFGNIEGGQITPSLIERMVINTKVSNLGERLPKTNADYTPLQRGRAKIKSESKESARTIIKETKDRLAKADEILNMLIC